jgi:hypothetical protein
VFTGTPFLPAPGQSPVEDLAAAYPLSPWAEGAWTPQVAGTLHATAWHAGWPIAVGALAYSCTTLALRPR